MQGLIAKTILSEEFSRFNRRRTSIDSSAHSLSFRALGFIHVEVESRMQVFNHEGDVLFLDMQRHRCPIVYERVRVGDS